MLNMNKSETSWLIKIKFHLKHYWDGEVAALGFGPDRIRTLVSIATDSSNRNIMGNILLPLLLLPFVWFFFILAGKQDHYKVSNGFKIRQDKTSDCGVSCP